MAVGLLESLGTIISLLAVALTLAGLAMRTRQNTQTLRSLTYSRALDRLAAAQARLAADAEMSELFSTGLRDPARLTRHERIRFTWLLYEMFGIFEFMHDQARARSIPPELWGRWSPTVAWWLTFPGIQAWWKAKPTPFNPRFSAFVESCIAQPSADEEANRRWQEFLNAPQAAPGKQPS